MARVDRGPPADHLEPMETDMTGPQQKDPLSRAQALESTVDDLENKVADEREAEGVPGKPSDREDTPIRVSENEPPD